MFRIEQYSVLDWFLPALINGDYSGMSEDEIFEIESWLECVAESFKDDDGQEWIFAHVGGYEPSGFDVCKITGGIGDCHMIDLVFRRAE